MWNLDYIQIILSLAIATIALTAGISTKRDHKLKKWFLFGISAILFILSLFLIVTFIFFPQLLPGEKQETITLEQNKYLDTLSEYTVRFPSASWSADLKWSDINWLIFNNGTQDTGAVFVIIRLQNVSGKDISQQYKEFEYELLEHVKIERGEYREQISISGEKAEVIGFTAIYNIEEGYTYKYGFGRGYFFINNKAMDVKDEYQIMCIGLAHSEEDAERAFYEFSSDFNYAIKHFELIK